MTPEPTQSKINPQMMGASEDDFEARRADRVALQQRARLSSLDIARMDLANNPIRQPSHDTVPDISRLETFIREVVRDEASKGASR